MKNLTIRSSLREHIGKKLYIHRFVPTLSPNEVADNIIKAMRCNEKFAILPGYLQIMLAIKW